MPAGFLDVIVHWERRKCYGARFRTSFEPGINLLSLHSQYRGHDLPNYLKSQTLCTQKTKMPLPMPILPSKNKPSISSSKEEKLRKNRRRRRHQEYKINEKILEEESTLECGCCRGPTPKHCRVGLGFCRRATKFLILSSWIIYAWLITS